MSVMSNSHIERGKIYKEVLTQMRNNKKPSETDCPLNSKNLGIIAESDHLNRKCLCPICTCGKHICPSSAIKDPYPVSTFKSSYMSNYRERSPEKTTIPKNRGNFLPAASFDFETTSSEAYKPHVIPTPTTNFRNQTSSPPKTPFHSNSSYASNFINWGVAMNQIVKPGHQKHTVAEAKLNGKSSYQGNFGELNEDDLKLARQGKVNDQKKSHIDPLAKFDKMTMNRREFVDYSKKCNRETGYKPDTNMTRLKSVDNHYMTTNRKDYKSILGEPDARSLRRLIEREGLVP